MAGECSHSPDVIGQYSNDGRDYHDPNPSWSQAAKKLETQQELQVGTEKEKPIHVPGRSAQLVIVRCSGRQQDRAQSQ